MKAELLEILQACPSTEPATFSEFLRGLKDVPSKGDREAWADLFDRVRQVENMGLIEVERGDSSRMESFMLTGEGIAVLKK
jgi:hypothetical protein